MKIELTETEISGIVAHGRHVMAAAMAEYRRLRLHFPAITDGAIHAMGERLVRSGGVIGQDEQIDLPAYYFACFEWMAQTASRQFSRLQTPEADGEAVRLAFVGTAELYRPLAALIVLKDGGPLSLSFVAEEVAHRRVSVASKGGQGKAERLKPLEDKTIALCDPWKWKTATEAAADITPRILELDRELARRQGRKPLLKGNTAAVLDWIRKYRRPK